MNTERNEQIAESQDGLARDEIRIESTLMVKTIDGRTSQDDESSSELSFEEYERRSNEKSSSPLNIV